MTTDPDALPPEREPPQLSEDSPRTPGQKIGTVYRSTALIWFNICLLFLLVNVAVLPLIETPERDPNPVVARHGERIYDAYPDLTRPQVDSLLNEAYLFPGFMYEPYAQFRERPRNGRYVTVSQHGFRVIRPQGPWPLDTTFFNVFVFGGSTTFGYGVADAETIPARMQAHLLVRSQGKRPRVYNFGRGYYFSAQERVLFEALLHQGIRPDLAVFIDGANDLSIWRGQEGQPFFTRHLAGFFQQMSRSLYWSVNMPLLLYLRQRNQQRRQAERQQAAPTVERRGASWGPMPRPPGVPMVAPVVSRSPVRPAADPQQATPAPPAPQGEVWQEMVDRYFRNQRMIQAVADTFGVETLFVWQPVPFYRYDAQTYHFLQEATPAPLWGEAHRMVEVAARAAPNPRFLVLSAIQQQEKQNLYVDGIHYNKYFSNVIALRIVHHYLTHLSPDRLAPAFRTVPGEAP